MMDKCVPKIMFAALVTLAMAATSAVAQEPLPSPSPSRPGSTIPGVQAFDPSENVKALSEAASKRQDDLRIAAEKLVQAQMQAAEKFNDAAAVHNKELREAAVFRLDAEAKLRAEYTDRLLIAEAKRIDAIRAVDVNAVAVASQRTSEGVTALATQTSQSAEVLRNQVAQSAEALRGLVASTAATATTNQQTLIGALSARITTLEQAGAEGLGKQKYQDPQQAALLSTLTEEVRKVSRAQSDIAGVGSGRSDVVGWIAAGITLFIAIAGFVFMTTRPKQSH